MLPILFILFLSGVILINSYEKLENTNALLELNQTIDNINRVTHNLQSERGLTTGYLSSRKNNFREKLDSQRALTDHSIGLFHQKFNSTPSKKIEPELKIHIGHVNDWESQLTLQRKLIDKKAIRSQQAQDYYTQLVEHLLDIPTTMTSGNSNARLAFMVTAYTAVFRLKEAAGLQRALGVTALEQQTFSADKYKAFVMLNGEQKSMLRTVQHLLTPEQNQKWKHLYDSHEEKAAQKYLEQIFSANTTKNLSSLKSDAWFDLMSNKINMLKELIDQLVQDMNVQATKEIQTLRKQFNYSATVLISIVMLTTLLSWLLNFSIIAPVRRITIAMKQLARGQREMRFTGNHSKDELSQMEKAYEACRISLLKADVADNIRFHRQHIDLKIKTEEREYFKNLASVDSLTGAINRREFFKIAKYEVDKVQRYKHPLSLIMMDIDHFKNINDSYGHASGDIILKRFYELCYNNVRDTDVIARIGGEEFAILMPETDIEQAHELAERVRQSVSKHPINTLGTNIPVTCSIGVVAWNEERHQEIGQALRDADQALYIAKDSGRNNSVVYTTDVLH